MSPSSRPCAGILIFKTIIICGDDETKTWKNIHKKKKPVIRPPFTRGGSKQTRNVRQKDDGLKKKKNHYNTSHKKTTKITAS